MLYLRVVSVLLGSIWYTPNIGRDVYSSHVEDMTAPD
jgi:hypothetical protein